MDDPPFPDDAAADLLEPRPDSFAALSERGFVPPFVELLVQSTKGAVRQRHDRCGAIPQLGPVRSGTSDVRTVTLVEGSKGLQAAIAEILPRLAPAKTVAATVR